MPLILILIGSIKHWKNVWEKDKEKKMGKNLSRKKNMEFLEMWNLF